MTALFGFAFWVASGLLAAMAIARPTTVGGVHNIGLLTDRICLVIAAGALAIMGCVFFGVSVVVAAVNDSARNSSRLAMRLADLD